MKAGIFVEVLGGRQLITNRILAKGAGRLVVLLFAIVKVLLLLLIGWST